MNTHDFLYTTGAFAKLNGINKRTLHYYNEIGLFCPEVIGENGYHYYTCFQTARLELILTLRKLGLSVEEIRQYTDAPSGASFTQLVSEKKELIDHSIRQLLSVKAFLQQKSDKLALGLSAEHGKIELVTLPEQKLLLSAPITGTYNGKDFATAADFSRRLKNLFGLYDNFGSRISLENIRQKNLDGYDCFFAYGKEDSTQFDFLRPAGSYLRTFCIGSWKKLGAIYQSVDTFAQANQLELFGYAYEEGLNEISIADQDDYITMITIAYRQK